LKRYVLHTYLLLHGMVKASGADVGNIVLKTVRWRKNTILGTFYSAAYMSRLKTSSALQSRSSWLAWAESADDTAARYVAIHCLMPAIANNWTRWYICCTTDIPPPQTATLGLHPVARKLLIISRPAEGRRLGWSRSS